jgi:DNA-binding NtrC family response regulator
MLKSDAVVLLVCPPAAQRTIALSGILESAGLSVQHSPNCRHAFARLVQTRISVVICDRALPDGDWTDVLDHMAKDGGAPSLIVTSPNANDVLWAKVLNLGGFDVLAQPFDREEVMRVVASALRANSAASWRRHSSPQLRPAPATKVQPRSTAPITATRRTKGAARP